MFIRRALREMPISLVILAVWALMAVVGGFFPLQSQVVNLDFSFQGPQWSAWFGYDGLGRPMLHRLIDGAQISFFVSIAVVTISMCIGTCIGIYSAYTGGWVDAVLVRVIDIFIAFPGILLVIALAAVLGPGLDNVILAMSVAGWVGFARLARAQVLSLKSRDHVVAAIALGVGSATIMRKHLFPLITAPIIIEATFGIAAVIVAEAGLSFLGLGVQPPVASWGSMIKDGTSSQLYAPHMAFTSGLMLVLVVLAVNRAGDWLRDQLDVKSR
ncbi:Oligopeptide transport system permease protein OppC (TC 3.A.1.5.1) [hydrothermal vent metagenome]|uniref:Oligopeptide transport system permease protein OppC (TC 3.A.1.5.1) n=1 Tax=hydrothermal vent metagenome TaxID=652676 RepID=A0A3B0Z357_9ZZZZ